MSSASRFSVVPQNGQEPLPYCHDTNNYILPYSFRKLINKKISWLKLSKYIPAHINVPETLVMYLHPKPIESFINDLTEEDILGQVLVSIIKRYLRKIPLYKIF